MEKELLISSLHQRRDSESSGGRADTDTVHDWSDRAPLIDSLQRELSSAQVDIIKLL